jgi:protein subunit release factor B
MNFHGISPDKVKTLLAQMAELNLEESDFEEKFVRASGSGGQKVNKTSSCVYLKHHPTGIFVKVDAERSQSKNRFFARRLFIEKYQKEILGIKTNKELELEKKTKQKNRRQRKTRSRLQKDIEVQNDDKP